MAPSVTCLHLEAGNTGWATLCPRTFLSADQEPQNAWKHNSKHCTIGEGYGRRAPAAPAPAERPAARGAQKPVILAIWRVEGILRNSTIFTAVIVRSFSIPYLSSAELKLRHCRAESEGGWAERRLRLRGAQRDMLYILRLETLGGLPCAHEPF